MGARLIAKRSRNCRFLCNGQLQIRCAYSSVQQRHIPHICNGTSFLFDGFAVMPLALLVPSGFGESDCTPRWVGRSAAAPSFLLTSARYHLVQTVGLALVCERRVKSVCRRQFSAGIVHAFDDAKDLAAGLSGANVSPTMAQAYQGLVA